jgi:hypothetical protein
MGDKGATTGTPSLYQLPALASPLVGTPPLVHTDRRRVPLPSGDSENVARPSQDADADDAGWSSSSSSGSLPEVPGASPGPATKLLVLGRAGWSLVFDLRGAVK